MSYWLAGTNTRETVGPRFKTKRAAIEYARRVFPGVFFVWKVNKSFDRISR
jgi:hypothetical protein